MNFQVFLLAMFGLDGKQNVLSPADESTEKLARHRRSDLVRCTYCIDCICLTYA